MIHHTHFKTSDLIRCLFLIGSSDDEVLGKEWFELIRRTANEHFSVEVAALNDLSADATECLHDFPLHSRILTEKNDPDARKYLPTLLADGEFDALVTMGGDNETFWESLGAQKSDLPVVASFVCCNAKVKWDGDLQKILVSGTDCFICESPQVAQDLACQSSIPASRVQSLTVGVDTDFFRPFPGQRWQLRQDMGFDHSNTVCGLVAKSLDTETIDRILATSKRAVAQSNDWRMAILGLGKNEIAAVVQRISQEHLDGKVIVRPDRGDDNVAMSMLDVYVVERADRNSRVEVLQAMACGLPVCLSFNSYADDLVINEINGLRFDTSFESAANAWIELCSNPRRRRQFGRVSRELAETRWSVNIAADNLRELLLEIHAAKQSHFLPTCFSEKLSDDCKALVAL
ncbi:MAG TPA: glycosyltransferase [Planctomycetes bacterium]|nr:glycosyltransferase [Planctomycetota bacterium]